MTSKIRNPKAYLKRAEHNRMVDEVRHDQTRQRTFERAFLHYDWTADDFEQSRAFQVDNTGAELMGRRDFTLRSPADIAQFGLDFEYYETRLRQTDTELLMVFRAVFYGFSWQDLGMDKMQWSRCLKKLEKFLLREA